MFEVIGTGRVAAYDNVRRNRQWYYWLSPGDRFDLATWTRVGGQTASGRSMMFRPAALLPIITLAALGFIAIWPAWRIARKAGYSRFFLICAFVPILNWFTLALAEWPLEREVKRVRANAN